MMSCCLLLLSSPAKLHHLPSFLLYPHARFSLQAREHVDGFVLQELTASAWMELGATSAVKACKLIAVVKREAS